VKVVVSVAKPAALLGRLHGDRPGRIAATVIDATPEEAVAVPSPVTEPAPAVCEKTTTVELSELTRLLPTSRISAVSVLFAAELTALVLEVKTSLVAARRRS